MGNEDGFARVDKKVQPFSRENVIGYKNIVGEGSGELLALVKEWETFDEIQKNQQSNDRDPLRDAQAQTKREEKIARLYDKIKRAKNR